MFPSSLTLLLALLLLACPQHRAAAGEKGSILAVFEIQDTRPGKLTRNKIRSATDYLASLLAEGGSFQVVPNSDLRKALQDKKAESYRECFEEACQIQVGRELSAQKSLATKISKLGSSCLVTSSLYDLKKSTTETSAQHKGKCGEDDIVTALDDIASQLRGGNRGAGFGKGLGKIVVGIQQESLDSSVPTASFIDLDTNYLKLVQAAKRGDKDKKLSAQNKAAMWQKVVRYRGKNPLKTQAMDRRAHWLKVEKLKNRYEKDHTKLQEILALDNDVVPPAQKQAAQKEFDAIYAPFKEALAMSGSKILLAIEDAKLKAEAEKVRLAEEEKAKKRAMHDQHMNRAISILTSSTFNRTHHRDVADNTVSFEARSAGHCRMYLKRTFRARLKTNGKTEVRKTWGTIDFSNKSTGAYYDSSESGIFVQKGSLQFSTEDFDGRSFSGRTDNIIFYNPNDPPEMRTLVDALTGLSAACQ